MNLYVYNFLLLSAPNAKCHKKCSPEYKWYQLLRFRLSNCFVRFRQPDFFFWRIIYDLVIVISSSCTRCSIKKNIYANISIDMSSCTCLYTLVFFWTPPVYLKHYDNLLLLGDLNSEIKDNRLNDFPNVNNFKSFNKEPTSFKNPSNPSYRDFCPRNCPRYSPIQKSLIFMNWL